MQLALTNVVTVSLSEASPGANEYNTSNLAIFTREVPNNSFGTLGYALYVDPIQVGVDFGTSSTTYKMAVSVFSQQPNILTGGGQLVVILYVDTSAVVAVQHIAFPTVPASGAWKLKYGLNTTGSLAFGANAATVQIALRLLSGLSSVTVAGDYTAGFDVTFTGVSGAATLLLVTNDSLQDATPLNVTPVVTTTTVGTVLSTETLAAAVTRTVGLVQYFGITTSEIPSEADMLAAAAVVQSLLKIAFFVYRTSATIQPGGTLDLLRSGGFSHSRGLYYGVDNNLDALLMMAAYAGRGLSTDFSGSNTTSTMHLKTLTTIQPDPTMTQTLLTAAIAAGADTYVSLQGVSAVFTSGENFYFDQIYNSLWFAGALQVAGFNYLKQANTKIPQTENGMDGLKSAYRQICQEAVTNAYSAPGVWTSSTVFGNPADLLANVLQRGFYVYSTPIAQQPQIAREGREAPLVQIALKEAGAIQSSNVIVVVNA